MYYTHQILIVINKCVIYLMLILLFVTLTGNTAYAYSYEVTERLVPWGDGLGEVYTDVFDFDWDQFEYGNEPIYPEAWDALGNTAYICDFNMNSLNVSLIEINMDTGQILETTLDYPVYPEEMKIIAGEDEYFVLGKGQYWCYDYDLSKIWAIGLASIDKVACLNSSIYKLNNNLWGVVMEISEGWGQTTSYELWKINISNELVGRVLLDPPLEGESCVFDISPDGEVSFGSYTDVYGGIFRWNNEGNLERRAGGQIWEFENPYEAPEGFLYGPARDLKVNYDASVYSFEYTEEGISIKRYTYVPGLIPPVADFAFYPPQGPAPLSVTFQNYSCDEDGEIVRIDCDWDGDQQIDEWKTGNPSEFYHTFDDAGYINFILTVVDNDNLTDSWSGSVYVEPPNG